MLCVFGNAMEFLKFERGFESLDHTLSTAVNLDPRDHNLILLNR